MSHLVPAASTLIEQVREINSKVEIEEGEPDGLDRVREITFDVESSKAIKDAFKVIVDERIAGHRNYKSRLTVTFVPDTRADQSDPFPLHQVLDVLNAPATE